MRWWNKYKCCAGADNLPVKVYINQFQFKLANKILYSIFSYAHNKRLSKLFSNLNVWILSCSGRFPLNYSVYSNIWFFVLFATVFVSTMLSLMTVFVSMNDYYYLEWNGNERKIVSTSHLGSGLRALKVRTRQAKQQMHVQQQQLITMNFEMVEFPILTWPLYQNAPKKTAKWNG